MRSDWTTRPLEECMAAIIDYRGKSPNKTTSGVPLITAKIIKGGRIEEPKEFIADEDYEGWMRRGMPLKGDVVFTTEAPLGEVAQLDGRKLALAQRVIGLRGKPGVLDNTFLKFLMQSFEVQEELKARSTGTTVLGIKQSELRKVSLTLPPYEEQQHIGDILGSMDDKIEMNRRINATLEAMAQAVFKEWFVDGAKEEWEENSLSSLFTISKASVNPGASPETVFDHYSIPAFDDGRLPKQELGDAIKSNKFTVPDGCILISKLNPRFPRVWLPVLDGDRQAITSTEFIVCILKSKELREFVYGLFTSHGFASEFNNMATGSTGSHQRVRPESMLKMATLIADRSTIKAYSTLVRPMLERISANITESRTLAALRDTLLPKLMRGVVRVNKPTVHV